MDTALFLTFFLFFIQTLAQGAAMKWPEHRHLANCVFWLSALGALSSFIWYVGSNADEMLVHIDMVGRQQFGIGLALLSAIGLIGAAILIAGGNQPRPEAVEKKDVRRPVDLSQQRPTLEAERGGEIIAREATMTPAPGFAAARDGGKIDLTGINVTGLVGGPQFYTFVSNPQMAGLNNSELKSLTATMVSALRNYQGALPASASPEAISALAAEMLVRVGRIETGRISASERHGGHVILQREYKNQEAALAAADFLSLLSNRL